MNSDLSEEKKIKKLASAVKNNLEYDSTGVKRNTIHEVNSKDVQLVPYEINVRYNHHGDESWIDVSFESSIEPVEMEYDD